MDKFINRTKLFIFSKQRSIFSSALILAFMIVLSRLFGFLRFRILANFFNKEELDIFFASFRVPDLIFEILITGALTATLIPIFIKYQKDKKDLSINISSIINVIFIVMAAVIVTLFLFLDQIMPLITPGYSAQKIAQIIFFSRLLLIGQLPFLIAGNFLTGIGQADKMFLLTAVAPIIYNIVIISATVIFASNLFLLAPIIGVIVGAFFFFVVQLPLLTKSSFTYSLIIRRTTGLTEFLRMIVPRALTVIVAQIDATIDLTLTTLLGAGAYTVFYLAQHLQLLPVSVIGIAFGQASLPYLSEIFQEKKIDELKDIITQSILNLFFFTIPIMSFFIFTRTPLIRLFFGGQKFDWEATVATAVTLSYFSLSLPFHSVYYFLTRCFYAILDSKTPFFIGVVSIVINTLLSLIFIFVFKLPVWALAISFSFAMVLNVLLLFIFLLKRLPGFNLRFLFLESLKISLVTLFSSLIVYYSMKLMDGLIFDTSRTINVFFLLLTGGIIYLLLYLFLSWVVDVKEIYLLTKLLRKAREYQKKFIEIYTSYE